MTGVGRSPGTPAGGADPQPPEDGQDRADIRGLGGYPISATELMTRRLLIEQSEWEITWKTELGECTRAEYELGQMYYDVFQEIQADLGRTKGLRNPYIVHWIDVDEYGKLLWIKFATKVIHDGLV